MTIRDQIHYKVESIHQIHVHDCLCGFSSAVSRDRTKHIVTATLNALDEAAESAEYDYYENGIAQP